MKSISQNTQNLVSSALVFVLVVGLLRMFEESRNRIASSWFPGAADLLNYFFVTWVVVSALFIGIKGLMIMRQMVRKQPSADAKNVTK